MVEIILEMERSTDRYLHKKFKKQLSIEPTTQNVDREERTAVPRSVRISEPLQSNQNSEVVADVTVIAGQFCKISDDIPVKDRNDSVPKLSTNNESNLNATVLECSNAAKSSISHINVANVVEKGESIADAVSERSKQAGELVDLQQSSNSCISYVISKSSRVENQSQPESHFRAVNFDTRFNVSEPIAIPTADTSSILDNAYSKQYVTSKLVNVDKVGDISSNISIGNNDHTSNQEDSCNLIDNRNTESKHESHTQELGTTEKSSGGKYICSYCNLACSKPSVLQKHIRAHTNERPYPCVSCGFSFKTRSNLYKHCRSRTHANRVMGNKAQEIHNEADTDSQNKMEYMEQGNSVESGGEDVVSRTRDCSSDEKSQNIERLGQEIKTKPYKPRFHTAKAFFENIPKDNQKDVEDQKVPETVQNRPSNSDLLSLHINEVINKNNAIVNSNESYLLRKRSVDNTPPIDNVNNNESLHRHTEVIYSQSSHVVSEDRHNDEPLNLTNKTRKRCLSEVAEPAMHTSLIKELLLKNLYADSMQCPHCKMIFQTVTELELHKMRNCKGFTKSGARYSRSSSVNVASILTKNKNAFDNIPHLQNTTFPLKSPGPFLGKTRLVESDKCKSFSFDDGLPTFQSSLQNPSDILRTTLRYSLSPLTIQHDKVKKTPVKLFGGEVKITHTSGETKSFKIDNKDGDKYSGDHFSDYGGRLSENRVVKSSLQSGGTVLQNKPNYNAKQDSLRSSPDVIRVYESTTLSPSIDIASLEKTKFNFERQQNHDLESEYKSNSELLVRPPADAIGSSNFNNTATASYKYTNIMDFSQKAVKLLAPNLKQPNLTIPGVPIPTMPTKIALSRSPSLAMDIKQDPPKIFEPLPISRIQTECERVNVINLPATSKSQETEMRHIENIQFAQKQILLHQKMSASSEPLSPRVQSPNVCNPVNLLVNGKVVRYVPGIPGPVAADVPLNVAYANRPASSNFRPQKPARINFSETTKPSVVMETSTFVQSPVDRTSDGRISSYSSQLHLERKYSEHERISKSPKFGTLEIKTSESLSPRMTTEMKSPSIKAIDIKSSSIKSPNHSIAPNSSASETPKKFARPNTLALKPSIAAHKQHHGLTPTMFNQILISPDTPRVAKKYIQHFLHGNYFSYLGLKSSTKSVYCTLNKTQPFYVPHFKKLSMYSEWRQQDTKADKLYVSAYDSRQRQQKYSTAGKTTVDLVVHSSYKFVVTETSGCKGEEHKSNSILGGYESNEDYTYVRGRGRGRYVCDQCGIRCKKPSMLKKHIRTHTNDRPFTCNHCNFSFKTKGNLTKHMKSKAHTKNYAASSSSNSSAQQSGTQSSESDTDDSGMDSSDESTRQQEHEAAYGLLSLSQKTTQNVTSNSQTENFSTSPNSVCSLGHPAENSVSFMNTEQVTQVNNSNFAKNKILDQQITINFSASKIINEMPPTIDSNPSSKEMQNLIQFLGKTNASRPLTYPYTSDVIEDQEKSTNNDVVMISPVNITVNTSSHEVISQSSEDKPEQRKVTTFNVVQKHSLHHSSSETFSSKIAENRRITIPITISYDPSYLEHCKVQEDSSSTSKQQVASPLQSVTPVVKINDRVVLNNVPYNSIAGDVRKRKIQEAEGGSNAKLHRINAEPEAMDLSMPSLTEKSISPEINPSRYNGASPTKENELKIGNMHLGEVRTMPHPDTVVRNLPRNVEYKSVEKSNFGDSSNVLVTDRLKLSYKISTDENYKQNGATYEVNEVAFNRENESVINLKTQNQTESDQINVNYVMQENNPSIITTFTEVPNSFSPMDYDNSAMETLADVATKQVKLEKNTLAKSVASEYLKLATKHEFQANDGIREGNNFVSSTKEVNELIVKPEENKSCTICSKNFSKPSQLRLHMNIHYLERPFRCDPCSVSFRTKGHLQKHERSASHHNKLSSSPLLSSSEPRPFKCSDCNIAFRIHGHLAKHLRSKMHIMKLECLAKIPFGLYAELERANSLLTEINTTDGDQCLESLKALARKVFINDPSKLNQLEVTLNSTEASDS